MEIVCGVAVVAMIALSMIWWIASHRVVQPLLDESDYQSVIAEMDDVLRNSYRQPGGGSHDSATWMVVWETGLLHFHTQMREYAGETIYFMHRLPDGRWARRLASANRRTPEEDFESERLLGPAPGSDPSVRASARTAHVAWQPIRADLAPWLETSFQRCASWFARRPAYRPGMSQGAWLATRRSTQSEPWRPELHGSSVEVVNGIANYEKAKAHLREVGEG